MSVAEKKRAKAPKEVKRPAKRGHISASYNQFKEFEGKQYSGMKVGRSHKWYDDKGEWREKKITPDLWEISYSVTKRRAGRAPEGSGVPVGTEYHWYSFALKCKKDKCERLYDVDVRTEIQLAHKRADKDK